MDITLNIVSIYQTDANFTAYTRPYQVNSALHQQINAELTYQKLPEPDFFRVIFGANVQSATQDTPDDLVFHVDAKYEAIIVLAPSNEIPSEDLSSIIVNQVASLLLGYVRAKIQDLTNGTGFPTVTLPILPPERLYTLLEVLEPLTPIDTSTTE